MGTVSAQEQLTLFAGIVYLPALNRVRMPDGALLDHKRFNVMFPGRIFAVDVEGRIARSAWHAFTQSQAYRCPTPFK
jgi:hypothetical protein